MLSHRFHLGFCVIMLLAFATWPRLAHAEGPPPAVPSLELQAQVYLQSMQMKEQLLDDYRKLLEVYYELKSKGDNPKVFSNAAYYAGGTLPPTSEKAAEFASVHYDEFKAVLDADPRLKGNLYVAKMKEYGVGQANDIFQRLGTYILEPYEAGDRAIYMKLYRSVVNPIQSVAMLEAGEVYAAASKKFGYDRNGVPPKLEAKKEWLEAVEAKERELTPALLELEKSAKPKRKSKGRTQAPNPAAACAAGYGKL